MAKKPKQHKVDSISRQKVDQIVHEIETAQSQKVAPEEVLKRVSSYLEKDPSLTIPLIEALSRVPNPETAQLLTGMMASIKEKGAIKSIKRTLYKLRQKGVRWEEKPLKDGPILRPPKPAEPEGYLGAIDSTGSRIIVIARSRPARGLLVVLSIVNDQQGIQQFDLRSFSKKGFEEFVKSSVSSEDLPVVPAPGAYCIHLLREVSSLSRRLSKPLPQGYHDAENEFKDITWDHSDPIIYQHIREDEVKDQAYPLKESGTLHKITPFSTWFLQGQEMQEYVSRIKEAQESRIILTPDQKGARLNSIYREALEELFPEEKRLLWKRRLEEMAYILLRTGKEKEARATMSAAIDLKNPFSPLDPNPFIWNLLLKSIYALMESNHVEKGKEEKTSLIVTP
ncbi:MAG: hypothetical protein AMK74_00440 [Nitrospira bacterium SM23_35]|nr:MAG: hypothetical protein AMK74_00440 [Nitrospira bacterium SM23_35]